MTAPAYLIILSMGVGGAEKRFTEIWLDLVKRGEDVRLVVSEQTYQMLVKRPDLGELAGLADRIVRIYPRTGSTFGYMRALWPLVRSMPRGTVVHYPLVYFPLVHTLLGHRLLISWVAAWVLPWKWNRSAIRAYLTNALSFVEAAAIDVLNPNNVTKLGQRMMLRPKLRQTAGGTFTDFDHFRPDYPKRNEVVFLGRLEAEKNALAFVEAIPKIAEAASSAGDTKFVLLGAKGDQEAEIKQLLASEAYRDCDVALFHTADPQRELASAKIFLSLQRTSNYPSKALVEAMACGCIPVITDIGESRLMMDDGLACFIPAPPDAAGIAVAVLEILALPEEEFERRSRKISEIVRQRFRIGVQAEYFQELYASLRSRGKRPETAPVPSAD